MKMKKLICLILCLSICLAACLPVCAEQADERALRLAAYREALETLYQQHRYPDGEEADFNTEEGAETKNSFALCDVDGDGREELILHMMETIMAWQTEAVYRYDAEAGVLAGELTEYPAVTYYANGYAVALWSHNQGASDENFWPYNLYAYSQDTKTYELVASVDAWAKARDQRDYPDKIDVEGAGSVYLVTPRDGDTDVIGQTDYLAWLAAFDLTEPIQVEYIPLTAENIAAVGD